MTSAARLFLSALLPVCSYGYATAQESRPASLSQSLAASASEPAYTLVIPDPQRQVGFSATAINNAGDVLGFGFQGIYVYKNGTLNGPYIDPHAYGSAINDIGDVAGTEVMGTTTEKAFVYSGGQVQYLNVETPDLPNGLPTGINTLGQVVGNVFESGGRNQGFLYQNGKKTLISDLSNGLLYQNGGGSLPSASSSEGPVAINNLGEITGGANTYGGFLYSHGFTVYLPGDRYGLSPVAVNSSGTVAGSDFNRITFEQNIFTSNGGILKIIPNPPNATFAVATSMNDCGDIVGFMGSNSQLGPFLYKGGKFLSLASVFPKTPYNVSQFHPFGINNNGTIEGRFSDEGYAAILIPKTPTACGADATILNTPSSSITAPGDTVTYTIEAKNVNTSTSQFTINNKVGRDSHLLSCGVSGSAGTCTISADTLSETVTLPNLSKGSTATVTTSVTIAANAGDQHLVMDTAKLSSGGTADYFATAYTNIRLTADLGVKASLISDDGGVLHYRAIVTDAGPNNSHAALLLDPLPANTSFISVSTDYGTCSYHSTLGPQGSVRCPLGNLSNGVPATVDVVLQVKPAACPSITNTFSLTGQSVDTNGSNDSSTVVTALSGAECMNSTAN